MTDAPEKHVPVRAEPDVHLARAAIRSLVPACDLESTAASAALTAGSELAWNLVLHATGGRLTARRLVDGDRLGLELVAEDTGPGIPDVGAALTDGFSTRGGLGGGLPGARRLMDEFEIQSCEAGTRVRAVKWSRCTSAS